MILNIIILSGGKEMKIVAGDGAFLVEPAATGLANCLETA